MAAPHRATSASLDNQIRSILRQAKRLATAYRRMTGKPLGITGEVAELEAARLLRLKLAGPRQAGYDATDWKGGRQRRLQIKGRSLHPDCRPGQRVGSINAEKNWEAVLLVILDEDFEVNTIYEAERAAVLGAMRGSRRSDMSVERFRAIGTLRYSRAAGLRRRKVIDRPASATRRGPTSSSR